MARHLVLRFLPFLALTVLPMVAEAHFLWASTNSGTSLIRVGLQETPWDDPLPLGTKAPQIRSIGTEVLVPGQPWTTAASAAAFGATLDYGVLDRSEQGRGVFHLVYFAKSVPNLDDAAKPIGLELELLLRKKGTDLQVIALSHGKPTQDVEIVLLQLGKPEVASKTGADGTDDLGVVTGEFGVRAELTDPHAGMLDGKRFDLTRTYSTFTVAGPTLSAEIHAAFGDNHDTVEQSRFIRTAMAGKLTQTQLLDHLRQRAIVHSAIERIIAAHPVGDAFGPDQFRVTALLQDDLSKMGSNWPTPSDAWPGTHEFLTKLAASADKGGFYALGAFHVYYGGITHGGRMIGGKIESALPVKLTYYSASDGYDAYIKALNQIWKPSDRAEFIRGGKDAYQYIIANSNDPSFQAKP